jgi:Holliday junction resolvase RusA-like endonuclease
MSKAPQLPAYQRLAKHGQACQPSRLVLRASKRLVLEFIHPGQIMGKQRPRRGKGVTKHGNPIMYTPRRTQDAEAVIAMLARQAMGAGAKLLEGSLRIEITHFSAIPKSYSKAVAAKCESGELRPQSDVDIDNCQKTVFDALNKVIYDDDRRVVEGECTKWYVTDRNAAGYAIIRLYQLECLPPVTEAEACISLSMMIQRLADAPANQRFDVIGKHRDELFNIMRTLDA